MTNFGLTVLQFRQLLLYLKDKLISESAYLSFELGKEYENPALVRFKIHLPPGTSYSFVAEVIQPWIDQWIPKFDQSCSYQEMSTNGEDSGMVLVYTVYVEI